MDVENQLYNEFREYITSKVGYAVKILPKTPQSLSSFPTIIFKESSNTEYSLNTSTNGMEYVDQLLYTVEIYSKDITVDGSVKYSRMVLQELKQLTFEFFRQAGFYRMSCERGEYHDFTVDRLIIIEQGKINNWNKKII